MMKIKSPSPYYLKGTNGHAILLLHSFTGTNKDVKQLAKLLHEQGFTCYAPNYPGHGLILEELLQYHIQDWWHEVEKAYHFLEEEGYQSISATGVSLGGLMTLKLAQQYSLSAIAVMSAPKEKEVEGLNQRLVNYGRRMNHIMNISHDVQEQQLNAIRDYDAQIQKFRSFINDIMTHLSDVNVPANILYGGQDQQSYNDSANFIYEHLGSTEKYLNGINACSHLMTHGNGSQLLEENVITFFENVLLT